MHDSLYKSYSLIMKNLGFDRSISLLIHQLQLSEGQYHTILDAGCGTGISGLTLAQRFPDASVLFTDINNHLLNKVQTNAKQKDIALSRLSFAHADITTPEKVRFTNSKETVLTADQFDIVLTGAVIGYSENQKETLKKLMRLVKPNGYFINIEMNQRFFGRAVSKKYQYPIIPLATMEHIIQSNNFKLTEISVDTFPAKLTRTCYVAQKIT
ncbi:MAG: class I SAM-dependent methyltransferase [Cocleimonas sp.]|nr:class I SAM-dependent methyltransferase [Cocleimonas sp.]